MTRCTVPMENLRIRAESGSVDQDDPGIEDLLYCRCFRLERELEKMERKLFRVERDRDATIRKLSVRLITALDAERQLEFAIHRIKRLESCEENQLLRKRIAELSATLKQRWTQSANERIPSTTPVRYGERPFLEVTSRTAELGINPK